MRIHESVAEDIAESVLSGRIPPGDRLPSEKQLMERYDVGRSAVREALLLLQAQGFVKLSNGSRALVTTPSPKQIVQNLRLAAELLLAQPSGQRTFQAARAMIEIGLARNAAMMATPLQIEELHDILEENRRCKNNPARFAELDVMFHLKIAEISGNELIISLHGALIDWLTSQREVSGKAPEAAANALESHEKIYRAIVAKDTAAAEQAMQDHLDFVAKCYWKMV